MDIHRARGWVRVGEYAPTQDAAVWAGDEPVDLDAEPDDEADEAAADDEVKPRRRGTRKGRASKADDDEQPDAPADETEE